MYWLLLLCSLSSTHCSHYFLRHILLRNQYDDRLINQCRTQGLTDRKSHLGNIQRKNSHHLDFGWHRCCMFDFNSDHFSDSSHCWVYLRSIIPDFDVASWCCISDKVFREDDSLGQPLNSERFCSRTKHRHINNRPNLLSWIFSSCGHYLLKTIQIQKYCACFKNCQKFLLA